MTDQSTETPDAPAKSTEPQTCADARELPTPSGPIRVTCTRDPGHDEDHCDERVGVAWFNEGVSPAGLTQEERTHAVFDRLGVPRGRHEHPYSLVQRTTLFLDRLGKRMLTQVENNMVYHETITDALALLVGAPNSSEYRIKAAIAKLRAVMPTKKSAGGIHLTS